MPLEKRLKKSRLCVSTDVTTCKDLFNLIDKVGSYATAIKLHSDIIIDFSNYAIHQLLYYSCKYRFVIIEDRKFLDIGNTVQLQYKRITYADAVTVHIVNAKNIIPQLIDVNKDIKIIIVSDMSSKSLISGRSKSQSLEKRYPNNVLGYVTQYPLSDNKFNFIPGIHLEKKKDGKGQNYRLPSDIPISPFNILIVGRAIYESNDPEEECKKYL